MVRNRPKDHAPRHRRRPGRPETPQTSPGRSRPPSPRAARRGQQIASISPRAWARRHAWSYIFIALFTVIPVVHAFVLSLQNATIVGGTFVGLDNFVTLARDPIFLKAVGNTILYTLIVVAAQISVALLIAGLLQPLPARGQMFYRALFYLPLVNSAILVAMVWRWIFNPNPFGLANAVLAVFGLDPHPWIGSSDEALAAVILSTVLIIPG